MEKFHISFEIDTKTAENLDGSIATHKTLSAMDLVRKLTLECIERKKNEPEDMYANYWPIGFNHYTKK